ncbi:MAG: peptide-methionine (S)-S-oxide reductase MsrA [Bacteroidales bacterium]|nr:peptide-methionine (S)-S-oxide reductase MsrA [Bacteroidales bacterium]
MDKGSQYALLLRQVVEVVWDELELVPRMANAAALLHETFHFWWTGFYTVDGDTMVLGPFQGPVACMRIGYGKGVCGTAWKENRTIVVPDVEQFPGHIACSNASRSEIVVPMYSCGEVVAVMDIDSERVNNFDDVDRFWLERIAAAVMGEAREIYLAAGCFWGAQHFFKQIPGVTYTLAGFVNGNTEEPTYEEVYTDTTGFAEAVRVVYEPWTLPLQRLLELFFLAIDPTSLNKQGEDEGTRYRTGIYFTNEVDQAIAAEVLERESKKYGQPLCVELEPMVNFYHAEAFHQDYLDKHPQGYCHLPLELFEVAKKG